MPISFLKVSSFAIFLKVLGKEFQMSVCFCVRCAIVCFGPFAFEFVFGEKIWPFEYVVLCECTSVIVMNVLSVYGLSVVLSSCFGYI